MLFRSLAADESFVRARRRISLLAASASAALTSEVTERPSLTNRAIPPSRVELRFSAKPPTVVASVCTYNTFQARSALRDIGRALGLPETELDYLAKKLPHIHADQIKEVLPRLPELRDSGLDRKKFELLLDLCEKVAGFPRFLGTHLGGLVISREPLNELTPLQQAAKGMVITQFDKDDIEDLGLVKLDLLSLRTMSVINDTCRDIESSGDRLDYEQIRLDDPETYALISSGETLGVFQLESPAQRALQSQLGASGIEDVVASMALIRPGPIKGNMVDPYIARRQGKEPVTYLHPLLEPILKRPTV